MGCWHCRWKIYVLLNSTNPLLNQFLNDKQKKEVFRLRVKITVFFKSMKFKLIVNYLLME